MRTFYWVLAAGFVLASKQSIAQSTAQAMPPVNTVQTGPPAHPATPDQIREYLALTGALSAAHTLMSTMVNGLRTTSAPYYPKSFWDDLDSEIQKVDIDAICLPVYQRYLSEEEMRDVIAFYRSESGKKLLSTHAFLTRDTQEIMRKIGADIANAVYAKHKEEIEAAKKQYESNQAKPSGAK